MSFTSEKNQSTSDRSDNTTIISKMENLSISPKIQPPPKITEQSINYSESVVHDCPICRNKMNEPENNIRMEHCCKRTFHAACLRSWANQQTLMNQEGTCPMCRWEWPVEFLDQLFRGY
ncbi:hypothetical protein BofuT4_P010640.1 [Botrytis cinerea T4]|uniref:RING-type domain-containing protein n=1 Tax=Botryotinia fuckeliana (strain T4) TaxID=999810 RepID=G2XTA2_BOTF4|nr:hypothetical protein BofuT4_P010640.1 [Botrytis cinerea T4]